MERRFIEQGIGFFYGNCLVIFWPICYVSTRYSVCICSNVRRSNSVESERQIDLQGIWRTRSSQRWLMTSIGLVHNQVYARYTCRSHMKSACIGITLVQAASYGLLHFEQFWTFSARNFEVSRFKWIIQIRIINTILQCCENKYAVSLFSLKNAGN